MGLPVTVPGYSEFPRVNRPDVGNTLQSPPSKIVGDRRFNGDRALFGYETITNLLH